MGLAERLRGKFSCRKFPQILPTATSDNRDVNKGLAFLALSFYPQLLNISMCNHTIMERKEHIKALFFNYNTKHWHFEALVEESGLSRAQTNAWLKRLVNEGMIKRVKPKEKMPYYTACYDAPAFLMQKRLYAYKLFEVSGFLEHLMQLKKAKTIIIFGSFARSDWHNESDIDLFIYGNANDFEKGYYEKKLKREIQVFHYQNKQTIKRLEPTVIPNILAGIHVKGTIEPFEVRASA